MNEDVESGSYVKVGLCGKRVEMRSEIGEFLKSYYNSSEMIEAQNGVLEQGRRN